MRSFIEFLTWVPVCVAGGTWDCSCGWRMGVSVMGLGSAVGECS